MQQSACTVCSTYRPCVSHVLAYTSVLHCSKSLMLRDDVQKVCVLCDVVQKVWCLLSWVVSRDTSELMYPFVGYVSWSSATSVCCSGLYMILYSSCKLFWVISNLVCTVVLGCVQSCTAGVHCSGLCIILSSWCTLFWVVYNPVQLVYTVPGCVQSCTAGVHCSGLCIILCSRYTLFWARCITWRHTAAVQCVDLGCVCHMILYSQCTWFWVVCDVISYKKWPGGCACLGCSLSTALWPSSNLLCLLCREHTFRMGSQWLPVAQSLNGS